MTSQECAVPLALRQREQWQFSKRSKGPLTSNATSPRWQVSRNAVIYSPHSLCRIGLQPGDFDAGDGADFVIVGGVAGNTDGAEQRRAVLDLQPGTLAPAGFVPARSRRCEMAGSCAR
jgi:hypothetical protein